LHRCGNNVIRRKIEAFKKAIEPIEEQLPYDAMQELDINLTHDIGRWRCIAALAC